MAATKVVLFDRLTPLVARTGRDRLLDGTAIAYRFRTSRLMGKLPHSGGFSVTTAFSGEITYSFGQRQVSITPGQLLLVGAGTEFTCAICSYGMTDSFALQLPRRLFLDQQAEGGAPDRIARLLEAGLGAIGLPDIGGATPHLAALAEALDRDEVSNAERELAAALAACGRHAAAATNAAMGLQATTNRGRAELLRKVLVARRALDDRVREDISIARIAELAAISEFHLMRSFRQCFGLSVSQYVTRLRMQLAQDALVAEPRKPIGEIALSVGFRDASAFGRAFRRHWGRSPTEMSGRRRRATSSLS